MSVSPRSPNSPRTTKKNRVVKTGFKNGFPTYLKFHNSEIIRPIRTPNQNTELVTQFEEDNSNFKDTPNFRLKDGKIQFGSTESGSNPKSGSTPKSNSSPKVVKSIEEIIQMRIHTLKKTNKRIESFRYISREELDIFKNSLDILYEEINKDTSMKGKKRDKYTAKYNYFNDTYKIINDHHDVFWRANGNVRGKTRKSKKPES